MEQKDNLTKSVKPIKLATGKNNQESEVDKIPATKGADFFHAEAQKHWRKWRELEAKAKKCMEEYTSLEPSEISFALGDEYNRLMVEIFEHFKQAIRFEKRSKELM
jgi:hypothetical protein